jgi:sialic acid synthase SpsE
MNKTLIIAEIGECFNGDFDVAEKLIYHASKAGCDIVKFQTLDYEQISDDDPEKEWFKKIALNPEKIEKLKKMADYYNIQILFTPENVKTAQWLINGGLKNVKIASSCIHDKELIAFIKDNFNRVIMSTGMASLDEINEAVTSLDAIKELYIMHCISEYPTGPLLEERGLKALAYEDVRFNMMKILMGLFPCHKIGYSDHTDDILAPIVAVAIGAQVIEKHITLDRNVPITNYKSGGKYLGTDHVLSIEPQKLKEMVRQIREVEQMFGPMKWERTQGERLLKDFLRGRFGG